MSRLREEAEAITSNRSKHKDYDPEDDYPSADENEDKESLAVDNVRGREHYQTVGKSRIKKTQTINLDKKYDGAAVSRRAIEADENEDDDPFAPQDDSDDEDPFGSPAPQKDENSEEDIEFKGEIEHIDEDESIDSEEAFGSSDEGKFDHFTFRGSKANRLAKSGTDAEEKESVVSINFSGNEETGSSEEDAETGPEDFDNEIEDGDEDLGNDQDEISIGSEQNPGQQSSSRKREDLKAYLSKETKDLTLYMSQAANSDAKKGKAVKQQYHTYDRLLDARIKLQKGYAATNQLMQSENDFAAGAEDALESAKAAALRLYETIESFRQSMFDASASNSQSRKRKRMTIDTGTDGLNLTWTNLQETDREAIRSRRTILEKWSQKIKASDPTQAVADRRSKFLDSTADNKLTAILDTYILNEQDKHFYNASTAEQDDEDNITELKNDAKMFDYDDSLFYQSLLRDLITTRAATSSAVVTGTIPILPHRLHPSGNRQNKNVKDTKASKGRKIRYTVHEKLQNFMAAEGDTGRDTAMWTERGKNEFFGSLFGQDRTLAEDEDEGDVDMEDHQNEGETEALHLFRT